MKENIEQRNSEEMLHRWERTYENVLNEYLKQKELRIEELADIVWKCGVLEHIAPSDEDVREAREASGKKAWNPDDPKTYWRLMYLGAASEHASKNSYTFGAPYIDQAITVVLGRVFAHEHAVDRIQEEMGGDDNMHAFISALRSLLIERARDGVFAHGETPHERLLTPGDRGEYKNIPVHIEHITLDGRIGLNTDNIDDWMKLGEINNNTNVVEPWDLDASTFTKNEQ